MREPLQPAPRSCVNPARGSTSPSKHAVKSLIIPVASRHLGRETVGTTLNQQLGLRSCVNPGVSPPSPSQIDGAARIVSQRYKHLAMAQPVRQHIVLNDGNPARIAVLIAKPF